MDILAARKRAAERARAGKTADAVPVASEAPDVAQTPAASAEEPVLPEPPAFLPLPDTEYRPDDALAEPDAVEQILHEDAKVNSEASSPTAAAEPEPSQNASVHHQQTPLPDGPAMAANAAAPAAPEQEQEMEMLAFLLAREEYVVPVEQVREILRPREITPVPHTADYLLGVCSLRGTVMPVVDLSRRLGLASGEQDEKSRIVVLNLGPDDQVGLFVDRVRGVVRFPPSVVRPAPETVAQGAGAEFLRGIARKDDRLYILLDTEKTVGT